MIYIDETTRQRVIRQPHSGDINYLRKGDESVSTEVVPVIGPWLDYTGSDVGVNSQNQQQFGASENQFQGEDPDIQGEKLSNLGITGERTGTTRRRQILVNVDFKEKPNVH